MKLCTSTSSPGCTPQAMSARCTAAVPDESATTRFARVSGFRIQGHTVITEICLPVAMGHLNFTMQSMQIGRSVISSMKTLAGCMSSRAMRSEV